MAIEKKREDCYNRSWRSKCYCVGDTLLLHRRGMGDRHLPCPAFLFASMLISYHSYHVFLALTSLFFPDKNYFCREADQPLSHASRASSPFRGAFFRCCTPKASPERGGGPLAVERLPVACIFFYFSDRSYFYLS